MVILWLLLAACTRNAERVHDSVELDSGEVDGVMHAALSYLDRDLRELATCLGAEAILLRASPGPERNSQLVPQVGGASRWELRKLAVNEDTSELRLLKVEPSNGDVALAATLTRTGEGRYSVLLSGGECGRRAASMARDASGQWRAKNDEHLDEAEFIVDSALHEASRVKAIHDLVGCAQEAKIVVRVSTSPEMPERVMSEVRGASVWMLKGPNSVRVKLAASGDHGAIATLRVKRSSSDRYTAVFSAKDCGRYELAFVRLFDGWQRDWAGANGGLMAGECTSDAECSPDRICLFSWLVWTDGRKHWLGSGGHCEQGIRCASDVDCPKELRCDLRDRIQAAAHGALQAPRCK